MSVYTTPYDEPFLPSFVAGLKQRYPNEIELARCIILLPTKRGCLSLKEILQTEIRILPRIIALSDLEERPIVPGFVGQPLPPAIPPLQRLGILCQIIRAYANSQNQHLSYATALSQAEELATLLDEIYSSGSALDNLMGLVADQYAGYWQLTVQFLEIIAQQWPKILAELGYIEPAIRKRDHLRQIAHGWQPSVPVYMIGTTGTRPATAELGRAIINLPQGHVVLPGYDLELETLEHLPPTHPQHTLHHFVSYLGHPVKPWISSYSNGLSWLREAMAPQLDHQRSSDIQADVQVPELISCQTVDEEISVIGLIIRQALTNLKQTINVITPDQRLTTRLHHYLKRWQIDANSSLGNPLATTAAGQFLTLIAQIHPKMTVASWLGLLKHPFFYRADDRSSHLEHVRKFELTYLRQETVQPLFKINTVPEPLQEWYEKILNQVAGLVESSSSNTLAFYCLQHRQVAENLYGSDQLWQESDGQVLATIFTSLNEYSSAFGSLSWSDYTQIFSQLVRKQTIHDVNGIGSRVRILGTLEARQSQADVTILASVNEKVWPNAIDVDSWLNRQMRLQLGLPDPERKIGLAAHNFCLNCTGKQVYITRAEKDNGATTIPSRWWVRLQTIFKKYDLQPAQKIDWLQLARILDRPVSYQQLPAPSPSPALKYRPKVYTVTDIELLMRDPYSYYAKRILKLKKLPELEESLSAKHFGQFVHRSLDHYHRHHLEPQPCAKTLIKSGEQHFSQFKSNPVALTFWWPRFQQITAWLIAKWQERLQCLKESHSEISGSLSLGSSNATVTAIADRIDVLSNAQCIILDYKTGTPPTYKDIKAGLAPQLPLEALILAKGGFDKIAATSAIALEYWHLQGGLAGGNIKTLNHAEQLLADCEEGVRALLNYFLSQDSQYVSCPWGEDKIKLTDYQQLARVQEWL